METLTVKNLPSREERAKIGLAARAIYEPLQRILEQDHWGEYVAIDIKSGDYLVATNQTEATKQMYAKHPNDIPFVIRIGYRAVYHFGGSGLNDGKRL